MSTRCSGATSSIPWSAVTTRTASRGIAARTCSANRSAARSSSRHCGDSQPNPWPVKSICESYTYTSAESPSRIANRVASSRSCTVSAPRWALPRNAAAVSPELSNRALLTLRTATPAATPRSNTVGYGCQRRGSTAGSQDRAFSSRPVSGTTLL